MAPELNSEGNLPKGIHWVNLDYIKERFCDNDVRSNLYDGLLKAIKILQRHGCSEIYLDGSFTTNKEHPGDIDVCYNDTDLDYDSLLNEESVFLDFTNKRENQKIKFGCEFFPMDWIAEPPDLLFIDFFQQNRDGSGKGILGIKLT